MISVHLKGADGVQIGMISLGIMQFCHCASEKMTITGHICVIIQFDNLREMYHPQCAHYQEVQWVS